MTDKIIYLDHAAATPVDPAVLAVMQPYWQEQFYNPSALYLAAQSVAADIGTARESVAACLGVRAAEVVFTAGGTESDNLAIHGVMQRHPEAKLVVSAVEHEAVLGAASQYHHAMTPVDADGLVRLDELAKNIDDQTVLVSIMYANNEVGAIQPLRKVATLLQEIRSQRQKSGNTLPLYFHTDASQAANYLDLHANRLGVDLMTLNGGKIYGPKQTGALFVHGGIQLAPVVQGGGQERGLRSGTENVPGIIGFAAALDIAVGQADAERARLLQLRQQFVTELQAAVPSALLNGSLKHRLPNNVHITIPGADNERLVMQLDQAGILCAAGSACSASSDEPSHVLRAMGHTEAEARSSLRFTMGRATAAADITTTVKALKEILSKS
jgi:cysteine desulfurase